MLNNKDIFCIPADTIHLEVITKLHFLTPHLANGAHPKINNVKFNTDQKQTAATTLCPSTVNVGFLRMYHHSSHNDEISSTVCVMTRSCSITVRYLTFTIFWKWGVNVLYRWIWPWSHLSSCTQFKKVIGAAGQTLDFYTGSAPCKRNIYCYFWLKIITARSTWYFSAVRRTHHPERASPITHQAGWGCHCTR